jgi:hypothetical protein
MSKQVRFRRGTTAQHSSFTGALGEVTVDTDKNVTVVHDGTTAGGVPSARQDRPRGFTRTEVFTTVGAATWTLTGKTDLRRVVVTAYGGGGGGGSNAGGGSGGIGTRTIELADLTTNVTVTVGGGGASGAAGGTTSFGTYVSATGGAAGSGTTPGDGGNASGTNVTVLGGQRGQSYGAASVNIYYYGYGQVPAVSVSGNGGGGGISGGGRHGVAANGVTGGGGGSGSAGAQGCVIVEEIYGL